MPAYPKDSSAEIAASIGSLDAGTAVSGVAKRMLEIFTRGDIEAAEPSVCMRSQVLERLVYTSTEGAETRRSVRVICDTVSGIAVSSSVDKLVNLDCAERQKNLV